MATIYYFQLSNRTVRLSFGPYSLFFLSIGEPVMGDQSRRPDSYRASAENRHTVEGCNEIGPADWTGGYRLTFFLCLRALPGHSEGDDRSYNR